MRKNNLHLYLQHKTLRKKYRKGWTDFFINKYGNSPKCEICGEYLNWINGTSKKVCFDHKNGNELIQKPPRQWSNSRECNLENIKIWDSCKFGILCNRCNSFLPTKNRIKWLEKALIYSEKK